MSILLFIVAGVSLLYAITQFYVANITPLDKERDRAIGRVYVFLFLFLVSLYLGALLGGLT